MIAQVLLILTLVFGANHGVRVEVRDLEWPWCGQWSPGLIVIDAHVERDCPAGVPGIDSLTWVAIHEYCHELLWRQGYQGELPLVAGQPNMHGPKHQQCILGNYPWPELIKLY